MYKILVVEDDRENCEILEAYLSKSGKYETAVANDPKRALELAESRSFDLILLDIMLGDREMDGIELCVQLRKKIYCPILFLSCLNDDETIIRALRMGGDDYITKPFRYPVLEARIEAALRRNQMRSPTMAEELPVGDLVLSTKGHCLLKKDGETVYLSPTEFDLLLYFLNNEGTILRFEEIFQYVWKRPSYGDLRTVFTHVRNLRKKLEADPSDPQLIRTVPRDGYVFENRR